MFADAREVLPGSKLEFDVCVIGAGAAGIALTRALAATRLRVGLLESGGLEPDPDSQALYEGERAGLPYYELTASRLRFFGGTTNHWAGWCHRFQERDFETRPWIPLSGWPIRLTDVAPYYPEAARICGVEAPERLGGDVSERTSEFGPRFQRRTLQRAPDRDRRLGPRFREEFEQAHRITALLHANVLELQADRDVRRVEGVRVATLTGNEFSVTARAFVLATGAIENARILLASDSRRPAGLGNDHDLVGRCFLEHPRFIAAVLRPAGGGITPSDYDWHRSGGASIRDYLDLEPQLKRAEQLVDVQIRPEPIYPPGFANLRMSPSVESARRLFRALTRRDPDADFGRHVQSVASDLMRWQQASLPGAPLPVPRPEALARLFEPGSREAAVEFRHIFGDIITYGMVQTGRIPIEEYNLTAIVQPAPNPDSRITLSGERDALGVQRVKLDWRLGSQDLRSLRRTLEHYATAVGEAGLGRVRILEEARGERWPHGIVRGGWHQMGTTRMSDDPSTGVVDRDCRVHGLGNLFVAGSSVFPTAGSGSPTLTLVALALRLADHLEGMLS